MELDEKIFTILCVLFGIPILGSGLIIMWGFFLSLLTAALGY